MDMWLLSILPTLIVPWVFKMVWPHQIRWVELAISLAAGCLITSVVYAIGAYGQAADVEIINGEVTSKSRTHGSYIRTYSCNCTQQCTGTGNSRSCTQVCQTCTEHRYTVDWVSHTTVGDFTIDSRDTTSSSVYMTPDPQFYKNILTGDPVAARHSYINYVKAAPDSLFHHFDVKTSKFKDMVPAYPDKVYNYYNLDRALTVNVPIPDLAAWNADISNIVKKLGPQKQANVVILFVNTADQSYIHALEGKWIGGKKNDIIVVIGTTNYPNIDWVAISSWTDSQLFKVQLRDDIMALGVVDRSKIIPLITTHTMASYKRKEMKDFEYLKDKVQPPVWVLTLAIALGIIISVGSSFFFYRYDLR